MELAIYQIDAFASKPFEGNPAAICPLQKWLPDDLMQAIAAENNLSETAFFVESANGYHIRWFTPVHEVDLCGHATLASAYVIFDILGSSHDVIEFESRSGILKVTRINEWLEMDFPSQPPAVCETPRELVEAFGVEPVACLKSEDYIVVLDNEQDIIDASPDHSLLERLDLRGVAITSTSQYYDFVTRFFAPKCGINEDPVTGSAFTQLIPFWSEKLDKDVLRAKQVSPRGGEVNCQLMGDRVTISGKCTKYMSGKIDINY